METALLINPDKIVTVELKRGKRWIRLALRLARAFTGGDLVRFTDDAVVSIKGDDELSSSYTRANWASGVASGALYAFRALGITRQQRSID